MKKISRPARAGHDRWLVSYADFVTLLFAFFTTLYAAQAVNATGQTASSEAQTSTEAARDDATESPTPAPEGAPEVVPGVVPDPTDALRERLASRLEDDVRLQRADIVRDLRGVVVSLPERATFKVGSAVVTADAKPLIARVVGELNDGHYALRIEGHTDDVPIKTARFPSNWELSTARAGAVVAYLINDLKVPPARLSAAGFAEFHPRVPNDSAGNRARNRRIDIVVIELGDGAASEATGE